jgi:hypothetical protein
MSTPTTTAKPAAVQFTNAHQRSLFIQDEVAKMAVRLGLNRTVESDYTTIFNAVLREHPELAATAKRSAAFTNGAAEDASPVLSLSEKAQFLNAEIDSIASARGMDALTKQHSLPALHKLALEKRPDLAPKRSAHFACNIFSKPPQTIGSAVHA